MPSTGYGGLYGGISNGPSFYNMVLTLSSKPDEKFNRFHGLDSDFECPIKAETMKTALAGGSEFLLKKLEVFTVETVE